MNFCKLIKKNFKFLEVLGFQRKILSRNSEYEIYYNKGNIIIEIYYDLCCNYDDKTPINDLIKNSYYSVGILIQHNGKRENIFDCNIFNKNDCENLKNEIDKIEKSDIKQAIEIYSIFIKENINLFTN